MRKPGLLVIQSVTTVQLPDSAPKSTTSLTKPPVTKAGHPPSKKPSPTTKINSILGTLTLKDRRCSLKKTSTDAKNETVTERSVSVVTLAEPKPSTASLISRKFSDSKKGKLQTAAMAQPIVSSVLGVTHTLLLSQPISHSSSSRKDDDSPKGQVMSVGDNTPITDITSLATDPSYLSSFTAPVVNISPQSQGEIQTEPSVFYDPSAKTQADDAEKTNPIFNNAYLLNAAFSAIIKGETKADDAIREMLAVCYHQGGENMHSCYHQGGENVQMNAKSKVADVDNLLMLLKPLMLGNHSCGFYHKTYIFPRLLIWITC